MNGLWNFGSGSAQRSNRLWASAFSQVRQIHAIQPLSSAHAIQLGSVGSSVTNSAKRQTCDGSPAIYSPALDAGWRSSVASDHQA